MLISDILFIHSSIEQLIRVLLNTQSTTSVTECYKERFLTTTIGFCTVALVIPLYELIIYPIIQKCTPEIKIHQKFLLGVTIQIVSYHYHSV